MVFRFRMLSDENDRFVRDYEVLYDMTLLEFHEFLLEALEYEPCMASFFTADDVDYFDIPVDVKSVGGASWRIPEE